MAAEPASGALLGLTSLFVITMEMEGLMETQIPC